MTLFQAIPGNFKEPWSYLGKQRAHYKRITDITFGVALDSDIPRLLSLGEDRLMVKCISKTKNSKCLVNHTFHLCF